MTVLHIPGSDPREMYKRRNVAGIRKLRMAVSMTQREARRSVAARLRQSARKPKAQYQNYLGNPFFSYLNEQRRRWRQDVKPTLARETAAARSANLDNYSREWKRKWLQDAELRSSYTASLRCKRLQRFAARQPLASSVGEAAQLAGPIGPWGLGRGNMPLNQTIMDEALGNGGVRKRSRAIQRCSRLSQQQFVSSKPLHWPKMDHTCQTQHFGFCKHAHAHIAGDVKAIAQSLHKVAESSSQNNSPPTRTCVVLRTQCSHDSVQHYALLANSVGGRRPSSRVFALLDIVPGSDVERPVLALRTDDLWSFDFQTSWQLAVNVCMAALGAHGRLPEGFSWELRIARYSLLPDCRLHVSRTEASRHMPTLDSFDDALKHLRALGAKPAGLAQDDGSESSAEDARFGAEYIGDDGFDSDATAGRSVIAEELTDDGRRLHHSFLEVDASGKVLPPAWFDPARKALGKETGWPKAAPKNVSASCAKHPKCKRIYSVNRMPRASALREWLVAGIEFTTKEEHENWKLPEVAPHVP